MADVQENLLLEEGRDEKTYLFGRKADGLHKRDVGRRA